ncbi:hypothetical protein V8G54_031255 [Vigna mungo]|uniref:Protein kinase domain-containing protein n=1 Tax=Vigna mungo TaxID=3915 RepID=A0AAQ3MYH9_VIGMU
MNSESAVSPKMELESGVLNSNISSENLSSKNMIFRANKIDKIDLKRMDAMLEKHLNRLFSESVATKRPKEAWDIDTAKLDLLYSVSKETYGGTVYRGTYDGQDVAVKVLDWGEDGVTPAVKIASLRSSFWQEVTVWQKLDHPNITKFIGASLDTSNIPLPTSYPNSIPSKTCCIVAEFLPGGTLKQYLSRNRQNKLPYEVVIKLALDLSRGCNMPFSKLSLATVSCALINKHLRPSIPRNCPSALANIIQKCWDPKPERRPEMREVMTMLEAIDTNKGSRMIRKDKNPLSLCFLPSARS